MVIAESFDVPTASKPKARMKAASEDMIAASREYSRPVAAAADVAP